MTTEKCTPCGKEAPLNRWHRIVVDGFAHACLALEPDSRVARLIACPFCLTTKIKIK